MTAPGSPAPKAESGLVVVDKPAGLTSHDVVSRVRRLARTRKVGHAGTLDPMATGVLLLGVNKGTRLLGHLALSEKSYTATVRLGAATTTDDAEGEVLSTASVDGVADDDVRAAAAAFAGDIEQVPSAVSAVKVDGQRAYKRVRAGEDVRLPARPVTVHELSVGRVARGDGHLDVELSVRCSSGTYIRAIARDLGESLGVGGHLTSLRRTAVGGVGLTEATPLEELQEAGSVVLTPLAQVVQRFFATCTVDEAAARDIGYGRSLTMELPGPGPVALLGPDGSFLALYERAGGEPGAEPAVGPAAGPVGVARPVAVFV